MKTQIWLTVLGLASVLSHEVLTSDQGTNMIRVQVDRHPVKEKLDFIETRDLKRAYYQQYRSEKNSNSKTSSGLNGRRQQSWKKDVKTQHKLGQQVVLTPIFDDFYYVGALYVGPNKDEFQMIWDTGSDFLWLQGVSPSCNTCEQSLGYDAANSATYHNSSQDASIMYGDGSYVEGFIGYENFFIDQAGAYPVDQFPYIQVTSQDGNSDFAGLVGLSRGDFNWSTDPSRTGPRFLNWLQWQNTITNRIMAFYMSDSQHNSFIDIGGYSMTNARDPGQTIDWITVDDDFFWSATITGVKLGDSDTWTTGRGSTESTSYSFYYPYTGAIFDSGTSMAYIPTSIFQLVATFITKQLSGVVYYQNQGFMYGDCSYNYPPIYFYIDGAFYGIDPVTYLVPDDTNAGYCYIGIMDYGSESFLLGDVFHKGYYTIYDDDNSQIAFVPTVESLAQTITVAAPSNVYKNSNPDLYPFSYLYFGASMSGAYTAYGAVLYLMYKFLYQPVRAVKNPTPPVRAILENYIMDLLSNLMNIAHSLSE